MRSQVKRCLKQKTKDFDRLYREHKQAEADHKRRGAEFDRQQDRLKELLKEARTDLAQKMDELEKKTEAVVAEKTQAVEKTKQLEAAAKEKLEFTKQRIEEAERARHVLNKLQTTYPKQAFEYESQSQVAVKVIVRLR